MAAPLRRGGLGNMEKTINIKPHLLHLVNKPTMIKFVKKAQLWCKTTWNEKGEQFQEWSIEKPTAYE